MQQVVYVDILVLLNTFVNYILLVTTGLLTNVEFRRWRLLLASLLGGLLALTIFLPPLHWTVSLLLKLGGSLVLVVAAFPVRAGRKLLRLFGCFFLANFVYAGAMLAVWFTVAPSGMLYQNGILYFDIDALTLCVTAILCYLIVSVILHLTRRKTPEKHIWVAEITHAGKTVRGKALYDTGNNMSEVFSGAPVLVVQQDFVQALLPPQLLAYEEGCPETLVQAAGVRLIPYQTVGGEGLLPAFRAQQVCLRNYKETYTSRETYIAYSRQTAFSGEYDVLAGNIFFARCREGGGEYSAKTHNCKKNVALFWDGLQSSYGNRKGDNMNRLWQNLRLRLMRWRMKRAQNSLQYINGPQTLPAPLTRHEEAEIMQRLLQNDESAREPLIVHNLRLVVYIARKFENSGVGIEDLISIGTIGLIKAVNTFCPQKNIKLATYASRCIENEILMHLRKTTVMRGEVSIDEPLNVDWDGNELLYSDILGSDPDTINKEIEAQDEKNILLRTIHTLDSREQLIMHMRFGIGGSKEHTQKEVADILGISQSYISRLEKRIIDRLRKEIGTA